MDAKDDLAIDFIRLLTSHEWLQKDHTALQQKHSALQDKHRRLRHKHLALLAKHAESGGSIEDEASWAMRRRTPTIN
jgi:hypothetical protein